MNSCPANRLNRLQKFQQIGIDFILMSSPEAMRSTRIADFLRHLDEFGRSLSEDIDRHDSVILTVHDQRGHVERLDSADGEEREFPLFASAGPIMSLLKF
jgi:hypothetical protein